MSLVIPDWVPKSAGERLKKLHAQDQGEAEARLLERLAAYEAMKTDVWEKLPSDSDHGQIIDWTFSAVTILPKLRRPYPKGGGKNAWTRWGALREKLEPLTDPAQISWEVHFVWESILKEKDDLEHYWPRFWEGDERITPDNVLAILDALRAFYCKMNVEHQKFLRALPNVKRWNDKTPQKFLSDFLSDRMKQAYRRPLDAVVAAIVGVTFDQEDPTASETIRGRRRHASPEKITRKVR
jgi:hypothetical protein